MDEDGSDPLTGISFLNWSCFLHTFLSLCWNREITALSILLHSHRGFSVLFFTMKLGIFDLFCLSHHSLKSKRITVSLSFLCCGKGESTHSWRKGRTEA